MAGKGAVGGESLEASVFLLKDIYNTTSDPSVKKNALMHLQLLKVKEDCRRLDLLADEYAKRFGKRPARMGDLVQAGLLPGMPGGPLGGPCIFLVAAKQGRASHVPRVD